MVDVDTATVRHHARELRDRAAVIRTEARMLETRTAETEWEGLAADALRQLAAEQLAAEERAADRRLGVADLREHAVEHVGRGRRVRRDAVEGELLGCSRCASASADCSVREPAAAAVPRDAQATAFAKSRRDVPIDIWPSCLSSARVRRDMP